MKQVDYQKHYNIEEFINFLSRELQEAGVPNSRLEARLLFGFATNLSQEVILRDYDKKIDSKTIEEVLQLTNRRIKREPYAFITGYKEFWGLEFAVNNSSLIPRADSETLIELCLELFPNRDEELEILDLGTGTGCLLLSLLHEYGLSHGIGVDINPDAVDLANYNAKKLKLEKRVNFLVSNWGQEVQREFDLIISNPPYISGKDFQWLEPEVREYEPKTALYGGDDGLECYLKIAKDIQNLLKPDGKVVLECGVGQESDIVEIFKPQEIIYKRDLGNHIRAIALKL